VPSGFHSALVVTVPDRRFVIEQAWPKLFPPGTSVRLFVEPATDRVDDFGRLLRYVVRINGRVNVNLRLVAVGAAAPYFYRGRRGRYANQLEVLAMRARAKKLGLWRRARRRATTLMRGSRHAGRHRDASYLSGRSSSARA
jgi:endonuclease YncB( thermonuclease family)